MGRRLAFVASGCAAIGVLTAGCQPASHPDTSNTFSPSPASTTATTGAPAAATPTGTPDPTLAAALRRYLVKLRAVRTLTVSMTETQNTGGMAMTMHMSMKEQLKPVLLVSASGTVTVSGKTMPAQEIMAGRYLYLKLPLNQERTGKPWTRQSGVMGMTTGDIQQAQQQYSPDTAVKALLASKDLHVAGHETVDGSLTTHYAGTRDLAALIAGAPAAQRELTRQSLSTMGVTGSTDGIWVDSHDRLVRTTNVMTGASGLGMTISMTFTSYNQPVHISPPPADQVADAPQQPQQQ